MRKPLLIALIAAAAFAGPGCIRHKVDPIEVTVNVNLRVDEELREFFRYENEIDRKILDEVRRQSSTQTPAAPAPAPAPTPPTDPAQEPTP